MPNFLIRMRQASKNYQSYKAIKEGAEASDTSYVSSNEQDITECTMENDEVNGDTMNERNIRENQRESDLSEQTDILTFLETQEESDSSDDDTDCTASSTDEGRGLLRYFFLTKLFV